ncbi:MAG: class I SAM-dependent methyltransferase [Deltaproteobacteria bacterium]|nr:MAG: class I SAM-dependent methyltransferase [Deltaproteobacteria bacterium]
MNILELPFDQYQRYKILQEAIDLLREDDKSLKILEVGGYPGNILGFLPEDNITIVDQKESKLPSYRQADALDLPFGEGEFDVSVSLDVLEHIPPDKRERFIRELWRTCRDHLLLAAPFDLPLRVQAEQIVIQFISHKLGYTHPPLEEHRRYGLSRREEIIGILKNLGAEILVLPNGNLSRWVMMMILLFYLESEAELGPVAELVNHYYNYNYYKYDNCEPCYRELLIASKKELPKAKVEALEALVSPGQEKAEPDFSPAQLLLELINLELLKKKDRIIEHKDQLLKEKENEIRNLYDHIRVLEEFMAKVKATLPYKIYQTFFKKKG